MAKSKIKQPTPIESDEAYFKNLEDQTQTHDSDSTTDLEEIQKQPEWIDEEAEEGQLSVDVFEEGDNIIIKSTIAGVEPENIDISIVNDMLTVRGERKEQKTRSGRQYFFQECYWGAFSRSIILPVEIDAKKIDASIKNGVLTVVLPKLKTREKKSIKVKNDDI